ncbi:hypothetical protein IE53DRAFT_98855 [Violaceomyces palustris]|uniref:Uncharacterized protein n=1 Tax=Violaceomyces palustris TaxID=1673888 RepID=A0ACD0NWZ6_9BASI|nr:hypothetical protein IE53DRAFT_98855 [Violaceomyces palustris]
MSTRAFRLWRALLPANGGCEIPHEWRGSWMESPGSLRHHSPSFLLPPCPSSASSASMELALESVVEEHRRRGWTNLRSFPTHSPQTLPILPRNRSTLANLHSPLGPAQYQCCLLPRLASTHTPLRPLRFLLPNSPAALDVYHAQGEPFASTPCLVCTLPSDMPIPTALRIIIILASSATFRRLSQGRAHSAKTHLSVSYRLPSYPVYQLQLV